MVTACQDCPNTSHSRKRAWHGLDAFRGAKTLLRLKAKIWRDQQYLSKRGITSADACNCWQHHSVFLVSVSGGATRRTAKGRIGQTRHGFEANGAEDGIRTRDPNLGKVVLYH